MHHCFNIHLFCTEETAGSRFLGSVDGWRSMYLQIDLIDTSCVRLRYFAMVYLLLLLLRLVFSQTILYAENITNNPGIFSHRTFLLSHNLTLNVPLTWKGDDCTIVCGNMCSITLMKYVALIQRKKKTQENTNSTQQTPDNRA